MPLQGSQASPSNLAETPVPEQRKGGVANEATRRPSGRICPPGAVCHSLRGPGPAELGQPRRPPPSALPPRPPPQVRLLQRRLAEEATERAALQRSHEAGQQRLAALEQEVKRWQETVWGGCGVCVVHVSRDVA